MQSPLISVIVPTYNRDQLIEETITSIIRQTYNNWECIIIDDGSTDNTKTIVEKIIKNDNRIYYVLKENGGSASARNEGLKHAKGRYIVFLDSDDLLHPDMLIDHLNIFKEKPQTKITISGYACFYIEKNTIKIIKDLDWSNKISENFVHDILFRWDKKFSIHLFCAMIDRNSIGKIIFNESLRAKEDWLFWTELAYAVENKVEYINKVLAYYRLHNENKAQKNPMLFSDYYKALFLLYEFVKGKPDEILFYERLKENILEIHQQQTNLLKNYEKNFFFISIYFWKYKLRHLLRHQTIRRSVEVLNQVRNILKR